MPLISMKNLAALIFSLCLLASFPLSVVQAGDAQAIQDKNPFGRLQVDIPGIKELAQKHPVTCDGQGKCSIPWISVYIASVYKYLIGSVGIITTAVLIWGGILWITAAGNTSRVETAKSWISSALAGMILALGSYFILMQINPDMISLQPIKLTAIKEIKPATPRRAYTACEYAPGNSDSHCNMREGRVKAADEVCTANNITKPSVNFAIACCCHIEKNANCNWKNICAHDEYTEKINDRDLCGTINKDDGQCCCKRTSGTCQSPSSGPCSTTALTSTCFAGNADASAVCNAESAGNPSIGSATDKCAIDGQIVSWGLFQINISAHPIGGLNCPQAFSSPYTGSNKNCRVVDQALYDQCVALAKDPAVNIDKACEIYNSRGWGQWGGATRCGIR